MIEPRHAWSARADVVRWTEGYLAASQRPWRRRPRRGRSAWHACGCGSREPGRPRRLHRKDRRGAGTGSPRPRPWTSHLASDGANRRCSDGTAGRRQRRAGGWAARSRRVSEYRRSGGIEPTRPRGGKGAPAGGTVGGKDGQHTEGGSRLHVTTPDSRTGQTRLRDGGGHRLASWTRGYATARSEAVCRGAGCGRTRTSGSVGGQGQQRPWSTRPRIGTAGRLKAALWESEDSETLHTSFVERLNLTIRQGSAYLRRRSPCHARGADQLHGHVDLLRCYDNFIRPHRALKCGRETRTPCKLAQPRCHRSRGRTNTDRLPDQQRMAHAPTPDQPFRHAHLVYDDP